MVNLKAIKQRMTNVNSVWKTTKTMRTISISKLSAILSKRSVVSYTQKLGDIVRMLGSSLNGRMNKSLPVLCGRRVKKVLYLLFTTDLGLCGGFNQKLIDFTLKKINQWSLGRKDVSIICFGEKGYLSLREKFGNNILFSYCSEMRNPVGECDDHSKFQTTSDGGKFFAEFCVRHFLDHKCDVLYVCYGEYIDVVRKNVQLLQLLPIGVDDVQNEQEHSFKSEPGAEMILTTLLNKFVMCSLDTCWVEHKRTEHMTRIFEMSGAQRNAEELRDKLQLKYNKLRQSKITTEIIEIISGRGV